MQRDEIVNEVNEMKNEMASDLKNVEEQKVSISKFSLADFKEPHEVIEYEEVPTVKERNNDSKMSLKDMTKNLMYLFKPIEGEQLKALVQINVEGDEGFTVYANIMDNKCSIFEGVNQNNDITIYVKDDKWKSIKWNDKCGDYEMSRLNNGAPVKSCSNYYPISKYNSPYEVERRARRQKFINSISSSEVSADKKIIDPSGVRWAKCEYCGKFATIDDFSSYGGPGRVNLGTCKVCSKNNRDMSKYEELGKITSKKYDPNICPECGAE